LRTSVFTLGGSSNQKVSSLNTRTRRKLGGIRGIKRSVSKKARRPFKKGPERIDGGYFTLEGGAGIKSHESKERKRRHKTNRGEEELKQSTKFGCE